MLIWQICIRIPSAILIASRISFRPRQDGNSTPRKATNGEYSKSELVLVLNRTDNGRPYRCEASNAASDEPKSASVTMTVLFKPQVVKIT